MKTKNKLSIKSRKILYHLYRMTNVSKTYFLDDEDELNKNICEKLSKFAESIKKYIEFEDTILFDSEKIKIIDAPNLIFTRYKIKKEYKNKMDTACSHILKQLTLDSINK